jgi:hypothetical protein
MSRVYASARILAILLSILSALVKWHYFVPLLLILGGVSALGITQDGSIRLYLVTIVLVVCSGALQAIPIVGSGLSIIFLGFGTLAIGGSLVAIAIAVFRLTAAEWTRPKPVT